jgi:outer membrane receptor protein involved in Fe transport
MKRTAAVLLSVAAFVSAVVAHAQDPSELQGLLEQSVVQTASKALETASTAPATSVVITAEELRRHGIHAIDEALNYLATSVIVERGQYAPDIGVRGVLISADYGDHVLLLVNGHTINDQWAGAAYFDRGAGIPFELIDHLEVILGPGSVLYGANAMLGVVNIVTKRAKDFSGMHLVLESEVPTSIRAMAGFGREFRFLGKHGEVTSAFEYYQQGGPAYTLGPITGTMGAPYAVDNRGKPGVWGGYSATQGNYTYLPTAYVRLVLGDFEINARAEEWKRQTPWSYGPYDDRGGYQQDTWLMLDVRHHAVLSSQVELSSRLYGDIYNYVERLDQPNGPTDCPLGTPCTYYLHGGARWVGLEEQATFDWTKDGRFPTLVGVDARLKDIFMRTDDPDVVTKRNQAALGLFPCADPAKPAGIPCTSLSKQLALYGEQKLRPVRWLGLSGGVRLDVDDAYGVQASPRGAAAIEPWQGGTLKFVATQAFRAPTIYERFYADGTLTVPSPNLAPEHVLSFEGSVEQKARAQRILLTGFGSIWNGLVASEALSNAGIAAAIKAGLLVPGTMNANQNENVSSLTNAGFSLSFEGTAVSGRLHYGLSYTGAYTRERVAADLQGPGTTCFPLVQAPATCRAILPEAAQGFGNARISYEIGHPWPTIGLVGRYASPRLAANSSPATNAPTLGAARLAITGKIPGMDPELGHFSYGVSADYSFSGYSPVAVGPSGGDLPNGHPQLIPLDRFRATVTLAYDLR